MQTAWQTKKSQQDQTTSTHFLTRRHFDILLTFREKWPARSFISEHYNDSKKSYIRVIGHNFLCYLTGHHYTVMTCIISSSGKTLPMINIALSAVSGYLACDSWLGIKRPVIDHDCNIDYPIRILIGVFKMRRLCAVRISVRK